MSPTYEVGKPRIDATIRHLFAFNNLLVNAFTYSQTRDQSTIPGLRSSKQYSVTLIGRWHESGSACNDTNPGHWRTITRGRSRMPTNRATLFQIPPPRYTEEAIAARTAEGKRNGAASADINHVKILIKSPAHYSSICSHIMCEYFSSFKPRLFVDTQRWSTSVTRHKDRPQLVSPTLNKGRCAMKIGMAW